MTQGSDYARQYGKANMAYCQGNFDEAMEIIEEMAQSFPDDPSVLLLRGHILLSMEKHELARQQYEMVLKLTKQQDIVNFAKQGLEHIQLYQAQFDEEDFGLDKTEGVVISEPALREHHWQEEDEEMEWDSDSQIETINWDNAMFTDEDMGEPTIGQAQPVANPFNGIPGPTFQAPPAGHLFEEETNPFAAQAEESMEWLRNPEAVEERFPFAEGDTDKRTIPPPISEFPEIGESTFVVSSNLDNSLKEADNFSPQTEQAEPDWGGDWNGDVSAARAEVEDFLSDLESFSEEDLEGLSQIDVTDVAKSLPSSNLMNASANARQFIDSIEVEPPTPSVPSVSETSISQLNWTEAGEPSTPDLVVPPEPVLKPTVEVKQGKLATFLNLPLTKKQLITAAAAGLSSVLAILLFSSFAALFSPQKDNTPATTSNPKPAPTKPSETKDNKEAKAPTEQQTLSPFSPFVLWMMLFAGGASFGSTLLLGQLTTKQIKQTVSDLQNQFGSINQGNFNVKATVYTEDELGQLSARFNQMAKVVLTTTTEAQRRAAETEQAKEDLQRQVIRLLDDVEGAARGDLTVVAEVTADVLGAVADAFNLTIENLRKIVLQVKQAAKQVNRGATDSELFARNQSSDALRMAEELAVTLNSVQMMTESIQRVAENAREAEEVARSSSVTALKGGEAVERTVAGILQIRERVTETARKVKRLAEASQEISKIVAVISQIASRTNLLALNASIQAARAGEAGRGFAIVADEVRQLADRSAKSLKEIEDIVIQIQSETGSVMQAMEEGIQDVINVTELSEQSKKSLEDIIQVSNHINTLVRSITADTVRQRENSREVAQVMQSVELTAQETSQESQRVAGSLQKLVGISKDLLSSVERFRVERDGTKN